MTTGHSVAKTLIRFNFNFEENDKEKNEPINNEVIEQKHILKMMKMLLSLDVKIFLLSN